MTVDRVTLRRDDAAWLAAAWEDASSVAVPVAAGRAGVVRDGAAVRLAFAPTAQAPDGERYLLGLADGRAHWAVHAAPAGDAAGLRDVGTLLAPHELGLLFHAVALSNWHENHTRCPRCGAPTRLARAGATRICDADGSEHFPRIDPAVIMLVHDGGDRCVLGRRLQWPPGRVSTLAGFVEPGETAEEAVVREVAEEVGLAVADVTYVSSQSWPFPSSLMLGYTARALAPETPLSLDATELAEAHWFDRDTLRAALAGEIDIPAMPPPLAIAYRLITGWVGPPGDRQQG